MQRRASGGYLVFQSPGSLPSVYSADGFPGTAKESWSDPACSCLSGSDRASEIEAFTCSPALVGARTECANGFANVGQMWMCAIIPSIALVDHAGNYFAQKLRAYMLYVLRESGGIFRTNHQIGTLSTHRSVNGL